MEASELDKNLGELEEKMERVRALYEQFFVGIEKIEPQIPRKDVDRRITVLRKEQIRNTAMRFKFQTLVQRYNTMQQHWMRTMREIENGTFKRDLLKAAARFGVDEALTAMGKKHAARLKGVIDRQRGRQQPKKDEIYEELSSSDLEFSEDLRAELGGALAQEEEDDAPTPPPQRVYELPDPATDVSDMEATHAGDEHLASTAGYAAAAATAPSSDEHKPLRHLFPKARGPKPRAIEIPDPGPGAGFGVIDPLDALPPSEIASPANPAPAGASVAPPSGGKKGGGGLRWGGGGGRRADPEALKRIASLAGVEGGDAAPPAPAAETRPRKPLLSSPLDLGIPDEPTVSPAPVKVEPPARKPLISSPIDIDLGLPPSDPPPPPARVDPPKPAPARADSPDAAEMRRPQPSRLRPPEPAARPPIGGTTAPAPKPSSSGEASKREFGDLNDGRLREIYAQYVQARRDRNESTAGITFEKLSDSLKTQAEKLKGQHKKRVDYEVVVKDGKTLIKPIVK